MTTSSPPIIPSIDTGLARWERHGRPGLPENGYVLGRPEGRPGLGVYRADNGSAVFEPEGHILRLAVSPDRRHLCVQVAERADEDAALGLVDTTTGTVRLFPDVRCGYDPMLWTEDSTRVELVAGRSRALVSLEVGSGRVASSSLPDHARYRLFPGGAAGLLAHSLPDGTRLTDRSTGREVAHLPAVARVLPLGSDVLVDDTTSLRALDPRSGAEKWCWRDPELKVTSCAVRGQEIVVVGVRSGRSVIARLLDGVIITERKVRYRGGPAVATGVSADADQFHVLVEGPTLPPRVVDARELFTREKGRVRTGVSAHTERFEVMADDGTPVPVVITSPSGAKGPTPLILTCYGGFGVPSLPVFEPTVPTWTEHGGRYAIAQVRGGGEHGAAWRQAGRGPNKIRAIEDLAAAARGLVRAGYTSPKSLVLAGASHGGVLASSCAFGYPDLCAGVVVTAAPLDLLSLEAHPLGRKWIREFGDPGTPEGLEQLRRISPLERARELTSAEKVPRFLGIVPAEDSRVNATDTLAVVEALRLAEGDADVWHAPRTGHGANHLESLHRLGATVLSFAELSSHRPTGSRTT